MDKAFVENTISSLGEKNASIMLDAIENTEPVVSIRRNPKKLSIDNFRNNFDGNVDGSVLWCSDGIYLRERPVFALDPLFHAGAYYVQEASSMAAAAAYSFVRKQCEGSVRVLDLCAAPGGKSTSVASLLGEGDMLVSNEVISNRATVLAENMTKWGSAAVVVTNSNPSDFSRLASFFDIILTDVPCSGEGMFRKDSGAMKEWSEANVALCASRQRKIVADVWSALRPGGFLVYSTCTFNHFENDDNVKWIASELGAEICDFHIDGPVETSAGLQFAPGLVIGEGFYCAVLRKNGSAPHSLVKHSGSKKVKCSFVGDFYDVVMKDNLLKAYPAALYSEMGFVENNVRAIRSGIAVAVQKGRDLVPDVALALSNVLRAESFESVELSEEEALKFLRLESLVFADAPRGFLLLNFKGIPLGFVKNLGNRSNNLFPSPWRLRL